MIRRISIVALATALAGCGLGHSTFTEDADVAPAVLYGAFADLPKTGAALSAMGLNQSAVRATREGENDLVLTVPSTEKGAEVTFRLHFACRETCEKTRLSATADVPATRVGTKVLDQAKVARAFHTYSQALIRAKERGDSPLPASRDFAALFDALRMIGNPALRDQIRSLAAADGQSLPLFGDEAGPPPEFGEAASPPSPTPTPVGESKRSYQAWAQEAAAEDEERHAADEDR